MYKNNQIKSLCIIVAVICCMPAVVFSAEFQKNPARRIVSALEQKTLQAVRRRSIEAASLQTVQADWEIVSTKTASHRRVSITVDWGRTQRIQTVCRGLVHTGKIYVAKSCYYPAKKANQEAKWVGSQLVNTIKNITLEQPKTVEQDWVVFEFPGQ